MLLLLPVLLPVIGGVFVFRQKSEQARERLALALILGTAALALVVCLLPEQRLDLLTIQSGLHLAMRNDSLAKLFLVLVCCIWVPVLIFSFPYIRHAGGERAFMTVYTMTLGVLAGLAMAANFVTMYMFFEMMSLITVPMVLHNGTSAARRAGFKYLGYSVFGAGMALAGYFFIAYYMAAPVLPPVVPLTRFGLRSSAAAAGDLLPDDRRLRRKGGHGAHAGMAACGPSRGPGPGVRRALRRDYQGRRAGGDPGDLLHVRRELPSGQLAAVCAADADTGHGVCGFHAGVPREAAQAAACLFHRQPSVLCALRTVAADAGGACRHHFLQMVFHAPAKDALFLGAGAIIFSTNYLRVDQLRGIGKRMPVTMMLFTLAALSLIGIPPMAGAVSKWYLVSAGLSAPLRGFGIAGLVVLIVSALLTAGYLLPIVTNGFFPGKTLHRRAQGRWGPR